MIILDTHIWHWWTNQVPGKLPKRVIDCIETADDVAVSVISGFEMAWLVRHGRIELDLSVDDWFAEITVPRLYRTRWPTDNQLSACRQAMPHCMKCQ